ncbi:sodium-coupled monocarboxylate transporter 1-like [Ctenocephalides felis]|uniref:sodium-coupled monocarboxylate transporter 1-like n=1 Tax=Ctenocephalides felis TaxID=7515 RepID=UPI000E6E4472|nr:sodium-coupled monocarboxylate transporter 1-like [Ctenocephalides felis]
MDVEELGLSLQQFGWLDYVFFVAMLLICIFIGIYFGFIKKVDSEQEYLAGGRNMLVTPISMSLIASYISGITLLGLPADVYRFGMQYAYVAFGIIFTGFAMNYIYLPVFLKLNITSTYEYLELRFNKKVRTFGSILYTIGNIAYLPIVIYVPALAFNQVTGVNVHVITPIVCLVCIFYTCVGGLKAVVWTDVIQTVGMFGSIILVIIKGTIDVGGFGTVMDRSWESGRLEAPDLNPDPTARHTLWTCVVGGCISWLQSNAVSQNMIQRYIALPSLRAARRAAWILVVGVALLITICSYCGLLMYATYYDCDPLTTKLARVKDQMLPLFVMRTLSGVPGLSGLFIAGVFSAALSSLSTCLNSMSAIVLEDFVRPVANSRGHTLTDRQAWYVMRLVVLFVGALCVSLVMLVERAGTVFQLTSSVEAITCGPLLGIFTAGMLIHWVNSKGAMTGLFCGLVFMTWLSLNAQAAIASGHIDYETKPLSAEGCDYLFNATSSTEEPIIQERYVFPLFRISYLWYSPLGAIVTALVACTVSLVTKKNSITAPGLLAPCVRKRHQIKINANESKAKDLELTDKMSNGHDNKSYDFTK